MGAVRAAGGIVRYVCMYVCMYVDYMYHYHARRKMGTMIIAMDGFHFWVVGGKLWRENYFPRLGFFSWKDEPCLRLPSIHTVPEYGFVVI